MSNGLGFVRPGAGSALSLTLDSTLSFTPFSHRSGPFVIWVRRGVCTDPLVCNFFESPELSDLQLAVWPWQLKEDGTLGPSGSTLAACSCDPSEVALGCTDNTVLGPNLGQFPGDSVSLWQHCQCGIMGLLGPGVGSRR